MGQFIQDGSRIMFETVMNVEESSEEIVIQEEEVDLDGLNYLAGKTAVSYTHLDVYKRQEPVRVFGGSEQLKFDRMEYDKELQVAELYYNFGKEDTMIFFVNASYGVASFGIDVEDSLTDTHQKRIKDEDCLLYTSRCV